MHELVERSERQSLFDHALRSMLAPTSYMEGLIAGSKDDPANSYTVPEGLTEEQAMLATLGAILSDENIQAMSNGSSPGPNALTTWRKNWFLNDYPAHDERRGAGIQKAIAIGRQKAKEAFENNDTEAIRAMMRNAVRIIHRDGVGMPLRAGDNVNVSRASAAICLLTDALTDSPLAAEVGFTEAMQDRLADWQRVDGIRERYLQCCEQLKALPEDTPREEMERYLLEMAVLAKVVNDYGAVNRIATDELYALRAKDLTQGMGDAEVHRLYGDLEAARLEDEARILYQDTHPSVVPELLKTSEGRRQLFQSYAEALSDSKEFQKELRARNLHWVNFSNEAFGQKTPVTKLPDPIGKAKRRELEREWQQKKEEHRARLREEVKTSLHYQEYAKERLDTVAAELELGIYTIIGGLTFNPKTLSRNVGEYLRSGCDLYLLSEKRDRIVRVGTEDGRVYHFNEVSEIPVQTQLASPILFANALRAPLAAAEEINTGDANEELKQHLAASEEFAGLFNEYRAALAAAERAIGSGSTRPAGLPQNVEAPDPAAALDDLTERLAAYAQRKDAPGSEYAGAFRDVTAQLADGYRTAAQKQAELDAEIAAESQPTIPEIVRQENLKTYLGAGRLENTNLFDSAARDVRLSLEKDADGYDPQLETVSIALDLCREWMHKASRSKLTPEKAADLGRVVAHLGVQAEKYLENLIVPADDIEGRSEAAERKRLMESVRGLVGSAQRELAEKFPGAVEAPQRQAREAKPHIVSADELDALAGQLGGSDRSFFGIRLGDSKEMTAVKTALRELSDRMREDYGSAAMVAAARRLKTATDAYLRSAGKARNARRALVSRINQAVLPVVATAETLEHIDQRFAEVEAMSEGEISAMDYTLVGGRTLRSLVQEDYLAQHRDEHRMLAMAGLSAMSETEKRWRAAELLLSAQTQGILVRQRLVDRKTGALDRRAETLSTYPVEESSTAGRLRAFAPTLFDQFRSTVADGADVAQLVPATREARVTAQSASRRALEVRNRLTCSQWAQDALFNACLEGWAKDSGVDVSECRAMLPRKNGFTVDRNCIPAHAVALLLTRGHSLSDLLDPKKLKDEKAAAGREVVQHYLNDDYAWLAKVNVDGSVRLMNALNGQMKAMDLNDPASFLSEESMSAVAGLRTLFELRQESDHMKEAVVGCFAGKDRAESERMAEEFRRSVRIASSCCVIFDTQQTAARLALGDLTNADVLATGMLGSEFLRTKLSEGFRNGKSLWNFLPDPRALDCLSQAGSVLKADPTMPGHEGFKRLVDLDTHEKCVNFGNFVLDGGFSRNFAMELELSGEELGLRVGLGVKQAPPVAVPAPQKAKLEPIKKS